MEVKWSRWFFVYLGTWLLSLTLSVTFKKVKKNVRKKKKKKGKVSLFQRSKNT